MRVWKLPSNLIEQLRKPLGTLFKGNPEKVWSQIIDKYDIKKAPKITTVGDVVSYNFSRFVRRIPDLMIIDKKSIRREIKNPHYHKFLTSIQSNFNLILHAYNPRSTLTESTLDSIKLAYSNGKTILFINGEEDLCTIPSVLFSPIGSLVFYGQPRQGVVAILVDEKKKEEFKKIFNAMEEVTHGA